MQFDLQSFLVAMLQAFLECREDGNNQQSPQLLMKNGAVVRFAVRRELQKQARRQGAKRLERKRFANKHMEEAIKALQDEVSNNFKD